MIGISYAVAHVKFIVYIKMGVHLINMKKVMENRLFHID